MNSATNGHRISKAELLGNRKRPPQRAVPDYTRLPSLLKDAKRWLLWRWDWSAKESKWDKPPSCAYDDGPTWKQPDRWATLDKASEALHKFKSSGLGFVMVKDGSGLVAIDLDDCVDATTKEICDWTPEQHAQWPEAKQPRGIIAALGGYWEYSVSGTGLRGFVLCPDVDEGWLGNKGNAEFYVEAKYLTVTGYTIDPQTGKPATAQREIESVDAALLNSIIQPFGKTKKEKAEKKRQERKARQAKSSSTGDAIVPTVEQIIDKMLSASNGDKIGQLWAGDLGEHHGDHSKSDSALVCHIAFYAGNRPELIDQTFRASKLFRPKWDEVHDGDGATYGEMTIANVLTVVTEFYSWQPAPCVCNIGRKVTTNEEGDEETITFPLSITEIIDKARQQTGDWPRRVGEMLFLHEADNIVWIDGTPGLFGFYHAVVGKVEWHQGPCLVKQNELFSRLSQTATQYAAVECLPHFPPLANHYYSHPPVVPGDGQKLQSLLGRFSPATDIDADLLLAAFVTAFWGGPGGARPAFTIISDDGRGVGKSTVAKVIGRLFGGYFDFSHGEKIEQIKKRLLTTEAATLRVGALDNLKTYCLSWAELEALITSAAISGHRLYEGERQRPNTLLWVLTVNGPGMGKDMAKRVVVIKLKRPEYSGTWEDETNAFIDENRWSIIADIGAFFQRPAEALSKYSRWGAWEKSVLARLPEPEEAQAVILERQAEIDVDDDEASEVEDYFAGELDRLGYDTEEEWVHIPNIVAREWMTKAKGEPITANGMTRVVKQWANEGTLKALKINPSRANGRGLLWAKRPVNSSTCLDLEQRIREHHAIAGGSRF